MSLHSRDSYVEILRGSKWHAAKVVDTDEHEGEILVNYLDNKVEEWICYRSASVRKIDKPLTTVESKPKEKTPPLPPPPAPNIEETPQPVPTSIVVDVENCKKEALHTENSSLQSKYKVGDSVLAAWSKSKNYPARVEAVLPNNEYRVQFEDGLKKIVSEDQMTKQADIIPDPTLPKYTTRHKSIDFNSLQNVPDEQIIYKKKKKKKDKIKIKFNFPVKPKGGSSSADVRNEIITQAEVHHAPDCEVESEENIIDDNSQVDISKPFLIHRRDGSTQMSTPIVDPKLPPGWHKHKALFNNRYQAVLINSQNRKFFSRHKLLKYLELNKLNYSLNLFDFACTDNPKKKHSIDVSSEKKIKTLPPSTPSNPAPSPAPVTPATPTTPLFSDFNVSTSGNYVCPKDDCKKEFRKENLLMMHFKHYHPEFKSMLPPALNVADLAYARTNSMDDKEDLTKPVKKNSGSFDFYHGQNTAGPTIKSSPPTTCPPQIQLDIPPNRNETKSSEPTTPPKNDFKLKELEKIEVADNSMEVDFESHIALFEITKKSDDSKKKSLAPATTPVKKECATTSVKKESANTLVKKESATPEKKEFCKNNATSPSPVKYEKMKKEEVVNCICGLMEEDGLMIQCDICLCWQHSHCSDFETENEVPEKYICKICKNPPHLRKSQKYMYDHDWLHKGILPTLDPTNKHVDEDFLRTQNILKEAHNITGSLCNLSNAMHNASIKMQIVQEPSHPKLYLWSQCVKTEEEEKDQGPVPEAPIDTQDCRLNLLTQVEQDYDLMEQKLNDLEKQIAGAESECSSLMGNPANDKPTLQMLIKDLETLRTLAIVN